MRPQPKNMNKEVVIAGIIGLTLGLIITYGVYTARTALFTKPKLTLVPSPQPSAQPSASQALVLNAPDEGTVSLEKEIVITGNTQPESFVVVANSVNENITTADNTGTFSSKVILNEGGNILSVFAIQEDGTVNKVDRSVAYLTEKLTNYIATQSAQAEEPQTIAATKSATKPSVEPSSSPTLKERIQRVVQENQDKVKGLITEKSKQKLAVIGQVQRVSAETLTVKTGSGTQIISTKDDLTILKDNKLSKIANISVDDYLTVIGYSQDDQFEPALVLASSTPIAQRNYQVSIGTVDSFAKNSLVISPRQNSSQKITIIVNKDTDIEDLEGNKIVATDIKAELQVLAVYFDSKDTKTAARIRVLSNVAADDK